MSIDVNSLRRYAPLMAILVTIAAGWAAFVRPVSAEHSLAAGQVVSLRQRELTLRREIGGSSLRVENGDPAAAFERQVADRNASPALLEQLARLAADARARNLFIETVEGPVAPVSPGSPSVTPRDPRFALFDVPVSSVPIRVAFDTDYASLGRFLWAFRDLPTTVEIRTLTVGLPQAEPGSEVAPLRDGTVRATLTVFAYARSTPAVLQASNAAVTR